MKCSWAGLCSSKDGGGECAGEVRPFALSGPAGLEAWLLCEVHVEMARKMASTSQNGETVVEPSSWSIDVDAIRLKSSLRDAEAVTASLRSLGASIPDPPASGRKEDWLAWASLARRPVLSPFFDALVKTLSEAGDADLEEAARLLAVEDVMSA